MGQARGGAKIWAGLLALVRPGRYGATPPRAAFARPAASPAAPPPRDSLAQHPSPRKAPPPGSRFAAPAMWGIILCGALVSGWSLVETFRANAWLILLPFLVLAVVAEFLEVQVYEANRQKITFSFTIAVTMASVTMLPLAAPLVNLTAGLVHVVVGRQRNLGKALFNLTNSALAAAGAGWVYLALRPAGREFAIWHLAVALAAALTCNVVNVGLISLMISLHTGRPFLQIARDAAWYIPIALLLGLTGAFLGGAHEQLGVVGTAMFVMPLLIMRYTLAFVARRSQRAIETLEAAKSEVEAAHQEKEETLRQLIDTVASIIDARDNAVAGHSHQVAKYAVALGRELGMGAGDLALLHTAGLFHDLGKVAIPEAILHKPARLTPEEYEVIKGHAAIGERILAEVGPLREVARMVGEHHERFEGGGYPRGTRGDTITLGGRILAVADTLDSILSDRPYSKGKPFPWALEELDRCAGSHFDPAIVTALHRIADAAEPDFFRGSIAERGEERRLLEMVS